MLAAKLALSINDFIQPFKKGNFDELEAILLLLNGF
tara:strand:- start:366 stop:473 length:108 start_codon:yes stop_codon:yes gene_type:complete